MSQPMNSGNVYTTKPNIFLDTQTISKSTSNTSPGTTRHLTLKNPGGGYTYLDFLFNTTLKQAIGGDSAGNLNLYASGGNYFSFYSLSNPYFPIAYMHPSQFILYGGYGAFASGVNAGSAGVNTSTLQSSGTTGLKTVIVKTTSTICQNSTVVLADATNASGCNGTPSNACSSYSTQETCEANSSHGGCAWTASTCSIYNGDQSSCESNGCTYESATCDTGWDEYTCGSYGCSYDASTSPCSAYDSDESGCNGNSMYCTWNPPSTSSCNSYNGDQTTCESTSGCTWDYMDGYTCNGDYVSSPSSCTGEIPSYTCNGSYYTGNCVGGSGTCSGTASCGGFNDSYTCGSEAGCSWSSLLNLVLTTGIEDRHCIIKNISTGGQDVRISAASNNDIEGNTSYTLTNTSKKDSVTLHFKNLEGDCSIYNGDEISCGNASCSYNTEDSTCGGSFVSARRWHILNEDK
jgi:hypothetical protein